MRKRRTVHGAGLERRRRRHRRAVVMVIALAATATFSTRPADAGPTAPAASGWYVTSEEHAAGIKLLTIRRDDVLSRGNVAIVPRSALYRLRTVVASNQLVGGTGRDITSNLCGRVHCHVAINGDRWDVAGHDTGRISGAVATGGDLIATQPLPPSNPAAHLLIGHDGAMDGTIDVPIDVAPEVTSGDRKMPVDVNRQPLLNRTSVIDRRYSTETRTPSGTVEYILSELSVTSDERVLAPVSRREGSGPIPASSLVVVAYGPEAIAQADAWWAEALASQQASFRPGLNGHREVIGGSPLLLDASGYAFPTDTGDGRHPRSIIGWNDTDVWLVTVDGRQPDWSTGLTLVEAAQLMRWLGATDALNLDGGASSTFVGFSQLRNQPSDGHQRRVASALVFMPPENQTAPPPPARSLEPACPPDRVPQNPFEDVAPGVHAEPIACMAWWNVTAGTGPGTYAPLRSVRRDQMAAFLARYLHQAGVTLPSGSLDAFTDDDDSIHEPLINALAEMDIVGGRGGGRYDPSGQVTRGQMATFLARSMRAVTGDELPRTTDFFADDSGHIHEPSINAVTEAAIAGGTADGRYRAVEPVRRDQMASFLARALSAAVEAGKASPPA